MQYYTLKDISNILIIYLKKSIRRYEDALVTAQPSHSYMQFL